MFPNKETVSDEDKTPLYSNAEWVEEKIRRMVVLTIKRGLQKLANEAAIVADDDSIVGLD